MRPKIEKAQEFLRQHEWNSWVILTENNRDIHSFYLTGRQIRSRHAIIVHAIGRPILVVHQVEVNQDRSLLDMDPYLGNLLRQGLGREPRRKRQHRLYGQVQFQRHPGILQYHHPRLGDLLWSQRLLCPYRSIRALFDRDDLGQQPSRGCGLTAPTTSGGQDKGRLR